MHCCIMCSVLLPERLARFVLYTFGAPYMRLSRVCFLKRSIDDLLLKSKYILKKREKFFGKIQFYKVQLADLYKMCIMKMINSSKKNSFMLKQMTGKEKYRRKGYTCFRQQNFCVSCVLLLNLMRRPEHLQGTPAFHDGGHHHHLSEK